MHLTFSEPTQEWYNRTRFQLSMFSMDFAIWKALVGFWLRTLPPQMHARMCRAALPQDDKKKKMIKEEMEALREFIEDAMGIDLPDALPDLEM
ncbi:hypothetical protein JR316_0010520 [Psilocybe cubensis]|nr:hypothetical protein JR316_0010520 [Psilocybe cubensis]KAH9476607.1 hypothetical protein JR316_0010520 [Psilocybe cubensis]